MIEALEAAHAYNPGLVVQSKYAAIGSIGLTKTKEGLQVVMGCLKCKGRKPHFKWCTLNAVRDDMSSLLCFFCDDKRVEKLPICEREFIGLLKAWGLDHQFAFQASLPGIHGRVDFMHLPKPMVSPWDAVIIQIDGTSHFTRYRGQDKLKTAGADMARSKLLYDKGAKLLRIHHADLDQCPRELVTKVVESNCKPCVVLSRAYSGLRWHEGMTPVTYPTVLQSMLGEGVCITYQQEAVWLHAKVGR